jgi:hypothetical protein
MLQATQELLDHLGGWAAHKEELAESQRETLRD